jgi:hypothetical protein
MGRLIDRFPRISSHDQVGGQALWDMLSLSLSDRLSSSLSLSLSDRFSGTVFLSLSLCDRLSLAVSIILYGRLFLSL